MTGSPVLSHRRADAKARASLKLLRAALRAAAKNPDKEKSIHNLRVSIRRFKQTLRVYAAYFDHTGKMRRGLRGLMDLCGQARDCDVALEVLEAAEVPAGHAVKAALKRRRVHATHQLAQTLKDWHIGAHMHRWQAWLTAKAPDKDPAGPRPKPASPELSREFRHSGAAASAAGAPYKRMHKFRLMVKEIRYTAEILGAPETRIERLRALQDRLGAINDCVITADLIAATKIGAPEKRKIKMALNRLLAARSTEFRAYWRLHYGGPQFPRKSK